MTYWFGEICSDSENMYNVSNLDGHLTNVQVLLYPENRLKAPLLLVSWEGVDDVVLLVVRLYKTVYSNLEGSQDQKQ